MKKTKIVAMGGLVIFAAFLLFLPSAGEAQSAKETYPTSELFAGFRYQSIASGQANGYGWGLGGAWNFHRNFGLAVEGGGVYGGASGGSFTLHDILIGPRITLRGEYFNVFVHALAGGAVVGAGGLAGGGFEFAGGGGVDYNINKNLAWRIAQVDYVGISGGGQILNNIRAQTGVVFRFH